MLESTISRYTMAGEVGGRMGSRHPAIMPFEAFATADGHIVLACGNDKMFGLLARALGLPGLIDDERFRRNELRVANREILHELIEERQRGDGTAS